MDKLANDLLDLLGRRAFVNRECALAAVKEILAGHRGSVDAHDFKPVAAPVTEPIGSRNAGNAHNLGRES